MTYKGAESFSFKLKLKVGWRDASRGVTASNMYVDISLVRDLKNSWKNMNVSAQKLNLVG